MKNQIANQQARLFLYDLSNSAKEHWFKESEQWEILLATGAELGVLEKKYFPVVSSEYPAGQLAEILRVTKKSLDLELTIAEKDINEKMISLNQIKFLVAYNPLRQRG